MKKRMTIIATAVAAMFGFAACDGENPLEGLNINGDVLGNITLEATNPQAGTAGSEQFYKDGDTANFSSALANVCYTTEIIEGVEVTFNTTVLVGTERNLSTVRSEDDIELPIIGLNLRDTNTGVHQVTCPIHDFSFFEKVKELFGNDEDEINWMKLITRGNQAFGHMLVVATDENGVYIAYEGSIDISKFEKIGKLIEGTINNVKAAYVSFDEVEKLNNMSAAEREAIGDLTAYFPTITLNGNISSRRAALNSVIEALENE